MKDGKYTILHRGSQHHPGDLIGSFSVIDGKIRNREGLAKELLIDGTVTPEVEFRVRRLNNGYNWVHWERAVAKAPQHTLEPPKYEP